VKHVSHSRTSPVPVSNAITKLELARLPPDHPGALRQQFRRHKHVQRHFRFLADRSAAAPDPAQTNLFYNLEVSATRFPDKPCLIFYDTLISYAEFRTRSSASLATCKQHCGVGQGDRVLLYMQNSPQFVLAYYAILRANAVVVPSTR